MHVAAVEADDEGQVGARQPSPGGWATLDEAPLLFSQLVLQAPGNCLGVEADGGGVQGATEGQDLGQQLGRQPIRGEPGELGLQVLELGVWSSLGAQ